MSDAAELEAEIERSELEHLAKKKAKKEKKKEKKDKKEKEKKSTEATFNDLAPEYQWNEGLDPDHIFEGELELINEVKKALPKVQQESDKFILIFLIARRHNVEETVELLNKFYDLQNQFGYSSVEPPSLTHNKFLKKKLRSLPIMQPTGFRDVHGRMLRYFFLGLSDPSQRDSDSFYSYLFWQTYYFIIFEPVAAWRNGVLTITDMTDFGWKNLDMSSQSRTHFKNAAGCFPFRLRSMVVVNGGVMVNVVLRVFKIVAPKKMHTRVAQMDAAKLIELIPSKYLLTGYEGGESDMNLDKYFESILQKESELYAKGIWKEPKKDEDLANTDQ